MKQDRSFRKTFRGIVKKLKPVPRFPKIRVLVKRKVIPRLVFLTVTSLFHKCAKLGAAIHDPDGIQSGKDEPECLTPCCCS